MYLIVKTNVSATTDPDWAITEEWPDAERIPAKGELYRLTDSREMRVAEVCQDGPVTVEIWLVPTYMRV